MFGTLSRGPVESDVPDRLFAYGVLEKAGESTRGGSRAYYRMPDREGSSALSRRSAAARTRSASAEAVAANAKAP
jgi:hypothetical protein